MHYPPDSTYADVQKTQDEVSYSPLFWMNKGIESYFSAPLGAGGWMDTG